MDDPPAQCLAKSGEQAKIANRSRDSTIAAAEEDGLLG